MTTKMTTEMTTDTTKNTTTNITPDTPTTAQTPPTPARYLPPHLIKVARQIDALAQSFNKPRSLDAILDEMELGFYQESDRNYEDLLTVQTHLLDEAFAQLLLCANARYEQTQHFALAFMAQKLCRHNIMMLRTLEQDRKQEMLAQEQAREKEKKRANEMKDRLYNRKNND